MTAAPPTVPQGPAVAFHVLADLLPPAYFDRPPPQVGARLQVVGDDHVVTLWEMEIRQAQALLEPLRVHDRILRVIPSRYVGADG